VHRQKQLLLLVQLDYPLALLSGVLLAVSFPEFGHPAFGWIALTPLVAALASGRARMAPARALALGFVSGLAYFAGTVYWTGQTIRTYGDLSLPAAAFATSLLVAYLAVFPALFALVVGWLGARLGARALILAPAVWVTSEVGRMYFWSGFPWLLLGYSQTTVLPVAQLASVVGVFGLSGLVAAVSTGLAYATINRSRRAWTVAAMPVAAVVLLALWGSARIRSADLTGAGTPLTVALVQGNVPQDEKWNPARAEDILRRYLSLTQDAAASGARLVIWPESATPFYYEQDDAGGERIREVVRATGVRLLFGSDQIEAGQPPRYYNAAFMLRPDGLTAAVYRKMQLVPFGEYVPLKSLLFFVGPLVEGVSDFSPGGAMVDLPLDGVTISTAICYEIVYPGLVRQSVLQGSQLLTTITNDAWYGYSSAPYQHFLQASMRAIEQGRYLVRAANTGISGIVDPYGHVLERSALFETTVVTGEVRLLSGLTVYGRIGDLFAYLCVAITLVTLLLAWKGDIRGYRSR
jgi:apolipoprotein N-acyltransferase